MDYNAAIKAVEVEVQNPKLGKEPEVVKKPEFVKKSEEVKTVADKLKIPPEEKKEEIKPGSKPSPRCTKPPQ